VRSDAIRTTDGSLGPDDVVFLHASNRPECIATVDKRFAYYTLQLMTRGSVSLSYDARQYALSDIWLWPCFPGPHIRFHETPTGRSWNHRHIAVTGPRITYWDEIGFWPRTPWKITRAQSDGFAAAFDEMIALSRRPERRARRRAANILERLLLDWADGQGSADDHSPSWLPGVMAALMAPGDPDYDALATEAGVSISTLRRLFQQATGSSPHDFRLEHRVLEARRLLGISNDPIKVIAQRLGYRDVYYFTRQFSQRVGMSPAAYRRARLGDPAFEGEEPPSPPQS